MLLYIEASCLDGTEKDELRKRSANVLAAPGAVNAWMRIRQRPPRALAGRPRIAVRYGRQVGRSHDKCERDSGQSPPH